MGEGDVVSEDAVGGHRSVFRIVERVWGSYRPRAQGGFACAIEVAEAARQDAYEECARTCDMLGEMHGGRDEKALRGAAGTIRLVSMRAARLAQSPDVSHQERMRDLTAAAAILDGSARGMATPESAALFARGRRFERERLVERIRGVIAPLHEIADADVGRASREARDLLGDLDRLASEIESG